MQLSPQPNYDFTIWRGIDLPGAVFTIRDSNGDLVNLTGWEVKFGSPKWLAGLNLFSITDPVNGQVTLAASHTVTDTLRLAKQPWDGILVQPSGVTVGPFVRGTVTIKEPFAHA
jgi:hypothetical protein